MAILYGFYQADAARSGSTASRAPDPQPQDAIAAGIGMVHQHFMLVEPFTVLENVVLGAEGGFDARRGRRAARAPSSSGSEREYDLEVDPDATRRRPRRSACSSGSRS